MTSGMTGAPRATTSMAREQQEVRRQRTRRTLESERQATREARYVGRSVPRREDRRLVTGAGTFVADIRLAGMLEAAVLRSPFARARILGIDVGAARALPGVAAVVTAQELAGVVAPFTRFVDQEDTPPGLEAAVHPVVRPCPMEPLASSEVRYVGQPVAVVVATSRYVAEDALELVVVDYEELPPVVDPEAAVRDGADLVHAHLGTNVQASFEVSVGDPSAALAASEHRLSCRVRVPRLSANPLETRAVLADWDRSQGQLTVWSSTQVPYMVRTRISEQLRIPEADVRVIAPDVGGGFGPKVNVYPEEVIVPHLARTLGRPVRFVEDRQEHLVSTMHARDQLHEVTIGFTSDGQVSVVDDRFLLDCGAYNPFSLTCAYNSAAHLRGLYRIPHVRVDGSCVLTNKTPNGPYRGAGRPEVVFVMDRVMHLVATRLGLDPAEVVRRNLITVDELPYDQGLPYRDGARVIYDGGNYPAALDAALGAVDYEAFRADQARGMSESRRVGLGISLYVEGTGIGPFEGASVSVNGDGRVVVRSGSAPHGQSHLTTLAQVCADALGVSIDDVDVRAGDTALLPYGVGTFASRSAVTAGAAVADAARKVKDDVLAVAGELLEADVDDLVIESGSVHPRGSPSTSVDLRTIARAAAPGPRAKVPGDRDFGLSATSYFVPPSVTFAYGVHVAVVEVDIELGQVRLLRYVVAHDCGQMLNPLVVEGQVQGGVAQGIGSALYEEVVYSPDGQPLATTFMDYLLPTAVEVPSVDQIHLSTPSERNVLGVRGVGEGGAISPPAAIANALADALGHDAEDLVALPLSPEQVLRLASAAARAGERVEPSRETDVGGGS
jgi:carbon-monoxide dehydrogenase large subunit